MIPYFLILVPGLLSAVLHRELRHKPMSNFDFIITALIYAFFITSFCFGIIYLRGFDELSPLAVFANLRGVSKYCVIASVSAVALPNLLFVAAKLYRKGKRDEA